MYARGHSQARDLVIRLDQIPRWNEQEISLASLANSANSDEISPATDTHDPSGPPVISVSQWDGVNSGGFIDPLTGQGREFPGSSSSGASTTNDGAGNSSHMYSNFTPSAKFPVDMQINEKLYLWRGTPWSLEVDAVVNSTNENLDAALSTPGLHDAAGPGLAEECAMLGGCRTGEAKMTGAYELPARRVLHTVGPRYTDRYQTAAENALSRCYRICMELLLDNELSSIAFSPIYSDAKGYPREPAAHVAVRTIRRFLERHGHLLTAVVICIPARADYEIYRSVLPLYFPRDQSESSSSERVLPWDVGDENGEIVIKERSIRIAAMPGAGGAGRNSNTVSRSSSNALALVPVPTTSTALTLHQSALDASSSSSLVDPSFLALSKDPDQRRQEQRELAVVHATSGWVWLWAQCLGLDGGDALASLVGAGEQLAIHRRWLTQAERMDLSEVEEMRILYRGGTDSSGRPVMVVVGAHFLSRCLELNSFVLHAVKEFEPILHRPFIIVYFHATTALPLLPDFGWMKRLLNVLGPRFRKNMHTLHMVHSDVRLRAAVWAMEVLVDKMVFSKARYSDRLLEFFRHVPREQMTIPEFLFMHDVEMNPQDAVAMSLQSRYVSHERSRLIGPS